jgi:hypothetical protein
MADEYFFVCLDCGQKETGETDCLKHTEKYGHTDFCDEQGHLYCPLEDDELN